MKIHNGKVIGEFDANNNKIINLATPTSDYDASTKKYVDDTVGTHNKGWFANESALTTAYPTAEDGDWAIVGSTDTVWTWDSDTNNWVDTDTKGQVSSVFGRTGDVVAQTNDYTWAQIDKTISDIADITNKSHTSLTDNEWTNSGHNGTANTLAGFDSSGQATEITDNSTNWNDAYGKRVDTWGDGLLYSTQTASVDYNTTNLKITSGQLNTIQDISTSSTPSFSGINVNTISNKDSPYVVFNGKAVFVKNGASNSDIQSALNYLKSQYGGTLYLMNGDYNISSTLVVENNTSYETRINIIGIGKPMLQATSTNYVLKTLGSHITIENIEIFLTGSYINGVYLGSSNTKIHNCRIYCSSQTSGYLIRVFGDNSDNIIITNNLLRGGNYQIEFRDAQNNIVISNNIFRYMTYGVIMRDNTSKFTITGNSLGDYSSTGIYIQGDRGLVNSNAGYVSGKNLVYLHANSDANAVVGNNGQISNAGTNNVLSGNRT